MPYEKIAKFDCVCAETGRTIRKGEWCVYYPKTRMVYHQDSRTAQTFRSERFDMNMLNLNY